MHRVEAIALALLLLACPALGVSSFSSFTTDTPVSSFSSFTTDTPEPSSHLKTPAPLPDFVVDSFATCEDAGFSNITSQSACELVVNALGFAWSVIDAHYLPHGCVLWGQQAFFNTQSTSAPCSDNEKCVCAQPPSVNPVTTSAAAPATPATTHLPATTQASPATTPVAQATTAQPMHQTTLPPIGRQSTQGSVQTTAVPEVASQTTSAPISETTIRPETTSMQAQSTSTAAPAMQTSNTITTQSPETTAAPFVSTPMAQQQTTNAPVQGTTSQSPAQSASALTPIVSQVGSTQGPQLPVTSQPANPVSTTSLPVRSTRAAQNAQTTSAPAMIQSSTAHAPIQGSSAQPSPSVSASSGSATLVPGSSSTPGASVPSASQAQVVSTASATPSASQPQHESSQGATPGASPNPGPSQPGTHSPTQPASKASTVAPSSSQHSSPSQAGTPSVTQTPTAPIASPQSGSTANSSPTNNPVASPAGSPAASPQSTTPQTAPTNKPATQQPEAPTVAPVEPTVAPCQSGNHGSEAFELLLTAIDADKLFTATVTIGTPPQEVKLQIDTGSSDLVVRSSKCTNCGVGGSSFDASHSITNQQFDWESSSAAHLPCVQNRFCDGTGQCPYGQTVNHTTSACVVCPSTCIFGDAYGDHSVFENAFNQDQLFAGRNFSACHAPFGSTIKMLNDSSFGGSDYDGIWGMAFSGIGEGLPGPQPKKTALQEIIDQNGLQNHFSLLLGNDDGGVMTVGGDLSWVFHWTEIASLTAAKAQSLNTSTNPGDSYYTVALKGAYVDGYEAQFPVGPSNYSLYNPIVDSGTTGLVMPTAWAQSANAILADLGCVKGTVVSDTNATRLPNLVFLFKDWYMGYFFSVTVPYQTYLRRSFGFWIFSGFDGSDDEIILGDMFMRGARVAFDRDQRRIGFGSGMWCSTVPWADLEAGTSVASPTNTFPVGAKVAPTCVEGRFPVGEFECLAGGMWSSAGVSCSASPPPTAQPAQMTTSQSTTVDPFASCYGATLAGCDCACDEAPEDLVCNGCNSACPICKTQQPEAPVTTPSSTEEQGPTDKPATASSQSPSTTSPAQDLIAGVFPYPPSGKELVFGYLLVPGGASVLNATAAKIGEADMLQSIDVAIREALKEVGFNEVPRQIRVEYDPNESRSTADAFLVYGITVDQQLDQSAMAKALGKDEFFTELTKFADARLAKATGDKDVTIPFKDKGQISVANSNGLTQCLLHCGDLIAGIFTPPPSGKKLVVGYLLVPGGAAVLKNVSASVGPADTLEFVAVAIGEALIDVGFKEVPRQVRVFYDPTHEMSSSRRLLSSSEDAKLIFGITVDDDLDQDALTKALSDQKFFTSLAKNTNERIAKATNIKTSLGFQKEGTVVVANSQGRTTCVLNCAKSTPADDKPKKLSAGVIALIIILCVVAIAGVGLLVYRKKAGSSEKKLQSSNAGASFQDHELADNLLPDDLQLVAVTIEPSKGASSPVSYEQ